MDSKSIAQIAADTFDANPEKSTEWCLSVAADTCGCDYSDVVDAIVTHTDISGFQMKQ